MPDYTPLQGLSCPRCGGMITIPEGQEIVICPFCDLRSVVSGEYGIRRYQVANQVTREVAVAAFQKFLKGNLAIARDVPRQARLTEVMVVHLPFWASWGRALGWVFGQKQVGDSEHRHYEAREVRIVEEMTWNAAACEVGEFGVTQISLQGRQLEPYRVEDLHRSGMVFEPVGSSEEAMSMASQDFERRVLEKANLDKVSQSFVRVLRARQGLVYYPLWVLRYTYRQRAFQVVVDGYNGEVLYGKAPGNSWYRAAVLVGGMALGAGISIDIPMLALSSSNSDNNSGGFAVVAFVAGFIIMYAAYRTFRYGEHYEYRRYKGNTPIVGIALPGALKDVASVVRTINRLR
jgi:hypothetical protein